MDELRVPTCARSEPLAKELSPTSSICSEFDAHCVNFEVLQRRNAMYQVENFVKTLADWAEKNRTALLCQLNSYLGQKEVPGSATTQGGPSG